MQQIDSYRTGNLANRGQQSCFISTAQHQSTVTIGFDFVDPVARRHGVNELCLHWLTKSGSAEASSCSSPRPSTNGAGGTLGSGFVTRSNNIAAAANEGHNKA